MTISSPEREAKKVKIAVDRNPVETSFEKWACDLKQGFDKKLKFLTFKKIKTLINNVVTIPPQWGYSGFIS